MKTLVVRVALAALCGAAAAMPLLAKDKPPVFVEYRPVKDAPSVALDPAKAYILLRTDYQVPLYLMKLPTAEDQASYDRLRADALVESHRKYLKKLKSYQDDKAAAANTPGLAFTDTAPVEPTEANFDFVAFGRMAAVGIGPLNRFAKGDTMTYLEEVTPGAYRIYGLMTVMPNGAAVGTCFCMGSMKFHAKAGEIVDLGVLQAHKIERVAGDSSAPQDMTGLGLFERAGADLPLDPRLAAFKVVLAAYKPIGKLPNYFGLTIGRMPATPGVMRYDRDRIVDLTTQ